MARRRKRSKTVIGRRENVLIRAGKERKFEGFEAKIDTGALWSSTAHATVKKDVENARRSSLSGGWLWLIEPDALCAIASGKMKSI